MQSNESKRSCSEAGASSPSSTSKRQRGGLHHPITSRANQEQILVPISSVTDSLSVPLSIIFREVPQVSAATAPGSGVSSQLHVQRQQQQRRNKPLLSRAEAQAFLTVTLLAQEMDSLVALSAAALKQQYKYDSFTKQILQQQNVENPYLRPLLPILHVMSQQIPGTALRHVQTQLQRVVAELQTTCISLRQFSEQNWTLSESLMDAGSGFVLAEEKKRLSDVQDETCTRIDALLQLQTSIKGGDTGDSSLNNRVGSTGYQSMKEYCEKIFQFKDLSDHPASTKGVEGTPNLANRRQSDDGQDVGSPMSLDSSEPSVQQSASKRLSLSMNNTPQVQQQVPSTSHHQQSLLSAMNHLSKPPPAQQSFSSIQDSSQPQQASTAATTTPRASPSMQPHPHSAGSNKTPAPHSEENHLSSLSAPEFSSTPAQQQASLSVPDSLAAQRASLSVADDSASQQKQISSTTSKQAPAQEKENVSSQEQQGTAYDLLYGGSQAGSSQGSLAESQNCRLGSATQSAAEVLSALATAKTRVTSSPK